MVVVTSFAPPTDGIKHQQPSTTACINQREIGKGTLYITESRLSWVNGCTGQGFSLEYPHIALHAVSRDLVAHPNECLYLMIDTNIEEPEPSNQENDDDQESDLGLTEIRFVPDDKGMLDAMFHAMSACQALHPDPQESLSEEEDETFEDAEDDEGEYHISGAGDAPIVLNVERPGESNGVHVTDGNSEPMETEEGQFEDADI